MNRAALVGVLLWWVVLVVLVGLVLAGRASGQDAALPRPVACPPCPPCQAAGEPSPEAQKAIEQAKAAIEAARQGPPVEKE